MSSPVNPCLISSISIHHHYSLLTGASLRPAPVALLHKFIVDLGFIELLSLVMAGKLTGFDKKNDDNGVAHHKNEAGADDGDGKIPEVLAGDLHRNRQLKGKLGDQDQNKANLDQPEKIGNPPELPVPEDGVGLLNLDRVDLE